MIKFGDGYSVGLKDALVSSLQIYNPNFNSAPNGITLAKNLYPDMFSINLETDFYDLNSAKTIYEKEIKQLPNKKFPTAAIYYQSDSNITELLKSIVGHWQQNLGIYINIESLPNKNSVKSKENDYSITGDIIFYGDYNFSSSKVTLNFTDVHLERMVIPLSLSKSLLSITQVSTFWLSLKVPLCFSNPSTSVVLPWST